VDARTPKDLIALGISGGIAPCPSALVLLLTAISFHRIAFGMVLVFVFSLGLAIVVSAVGVAVILMGDKLAGRVDQGLLSTWLPRFSAAVVTVVGLGISVKGADAVLAMFSG
jgi:ABC-type nickel/cobalt efflux system permease component RcnA